MKRDMDVVRKILILIEEDKVKKQVNPEKTLRYHLEIMNEAGLIKGLKIETENDRSWNDVVESTTRIIYPGELTWKGCDLLEKIRDWGKWVKIREICLKADVGLTLDTINETAEMLKGRRIYDVLNPETYIIHGNMQKSGGADE